TDIFGFPPPKVGLKFNELMSRWNKQGPYLKALVSIINDWPTVNAFDIIGDAGKSNQVGPKVRLLTDFPYLWPKDGSILIQFHRTVTGKKIELDFQRIKQQLAPQIRTQQGEWKYVRKRRKRGQSRIKTEIYTLANRPTLAGEWITISVDPMSTGAEVRRDVEGINSSLSKRRQRGQRRLKLDIFDKYQSGWSIRKIALANRRKRSTVYELFDTVCKDIGKAKVKGKPLVDDKFDPKEHFPTCRQCQTGPRLCRLAETHLGIDSINPMEGHLPFDEAIDPSVFGKRKLRPKIDD
ncbi:MAG: hypothetical protein O7B35_16830, partial [Deltaproteobacteria bacterium]|nr:hypothetical protein [Deltaproteobacteria bacterium]